VENWSADGGQIAGLIDRTAGRPEDERHAKTPLPQHRIQTGGRPEFISGGQSNNSQTSAGS
jgi:hypothetical protein